MSVQAVILLTIVAMVPLLLIVLLRNPGSREIGWTFYNEYGRPQNIKVRFYYGGVAIWFEGYSTMTEGDDGGEVVYVDNFYGHPYVYVWGDINEEDPTVRVSLNRAHCAMRDIDEEDKVEECPACGNSCNDDVTISDHGVCYDCHHEMLMGYRCRDCYEHGHDRDSCPDREE